MILTTNAEISFIHTEGEEKIYVADEKNNLKKVNLPNFITTIESGAFRYNNNIKSITLSESLTTIESFAFQYCNEITKVEIPNKVKYIGYQSFARMENLQEVIIGNGLTTIGIYAFEFCEKLSKVTLGESVEIIEVGAFRGIAIETIVIPSSVKIIGNDAVSACKKLKTVILGENVEEIDEFAFSKCISLNSITIPNKVQHISVTAFPSNTRIIFENPLSSLAVLYTYRSGDSIKEILPNKIVLNDGSIINHDGSIDRIGEYDFEEKNNLIKVHFPSSLKYISVRGFLKCYNLKEVIFESSDVIYDPGDSFLYCPVTIKYNNVGNIILPYQYANSNETGEITTSFKLSPYSFYRSKFTSITIEQRLKSIPKNCFGFCLNLTRINLPDSIETIGEMAFCYCINLKSILIPNSVKSIGENAFGGCFSIKSLKIPPSVENTDRIINSRFDDYCGEYDIDCKYKLEEIAGFIPIAYNYSKTFPNIKSIKFWDNSIISYYALTEFNFSKIIFGKKCTISNDYFSIEELKYHPSIEIVDKSDLKNDFNVEGEMFIFIMKRGLSVNVSYAYQLDTYCTIPVKKENYSSNLERSISKINKTMTIFDGKIIRLMRRRH
ncbi:surface antigen BspA-like [Trichomonas vaginalis G3]|uniref:Surface antigen BspA-like n=1 Tax=Trichomonas vaginalis (strain ATCC PRA-98 / G3) TaxID=412133 RepID=A2ED90_TRIV3|nr:antigen BSP-related family [Trichomonas vaginalis G3]EAY09348.1 surface antigen BspA-like [Trichomonas vaginalis G3]KAI5501717.1 antigen BSP-related family [Trichomonas vaginalis G3]|eukprot:XP_001321571.1 surface antigen BspA-like [Trichomonas vaginalis G3]